jgi:hypothetical protein
MIFDKRFEDDFGRWCLLGLYAFVVSSFKDNYT